MSDPFLEAAQAHDKAGKDPFLAAAMGIDHPENLRAVDPSQKFGPATPVAPGMPTSVQGMGSDMKLKGNPLMDVAGVGEAAGSLALQMGAPFATALVSFGKAVSGSQNPIEEAEKLVGQAINDLGGNPQTAMGRLITTIVGYPFEKADQVLTQVGEASGFSSEQTKAIKTALYAALAAKGAMDNPKGPGPIDRSAFPKLDKDPTIHESWIEGLEASKKAHEVGARMDKEAAASDARKKSYWEEHERRSAPRDPQRDNYLADDGTMKKWADLSKDEQNGYQHPETGEIVGRSKPLEQKPITPEITPEEEKVAFHVEQVSKKADAVHDPEATGEYKKRGFIGRVYDKLNITPLKRTARVSPPTADIMASHAGSYGQGNRITHWLVSKVHPEAFEHLPKYILEKVKNGKKLSSKEQPLYDQALRRNEFGQLLIKDRIAGIYHQSLEKVKLADSTIADLDNRLRGLEDQHRRATMGKGAQSDVRVIPDLEKNIKDLTAAIEKARADKKYYSKKATDILHEHDVVKYGEYVKNNMGKFEKELAAWKEHVNPYLDDLLKESKGVEEGGHLDTDNTGHLTGARVNLVHADVMSPEWESGHAVKSKADLATKEKPGTDTGKSVTKDPWDREAKGTGTYTTSLYGMLRPVVSKRWQSVTKLRLYDQLEKSGLGKVVGVGESIPHEIAGRPMVNIGPVEMPVTTEGKTTTVLKHLYVGEDIAPEVRQLFLDDKNVSEVPGARAFTTLQLSQLAVDAVSHGMNQFTLINKFWDGEGTRVSSKIPLLSPVMASERFFKTAKAVFDNTPEMVERAKSMGERGLLRDGYHVSWLAEKVAKMTGRPGAIDLAAGQVLLKMDTAARMLLDDHFTMMVEKGLAKDTPTNRRNFISQVGNYSGRMMEKWMADLRRSGIAPFVVAGATFNWNALRFATGHPGFETTGWAASLQLRSEHLIKPIIFGLTLPAMWNMYKVGHPMGRPGTPPGHLDMGGEKDENGKFATFNMMVGTPYDRFMRMSGGQALWEGSRSGKTASQIAGQAGMDALRSQKHVVWGPGMEGLFVAATGRDTDFEGRPHVRPKGTLAGKFLERGRAALEVTSPQLHAAVTGENAGGKLGSYAADKLENPVAKRALNVATLVGKAPLRALGISESHSARTAAEQEMVDRRAYLNDAPEEETKEARRILKTGIHMAKTNQDEGIKYLYDALDKGKITEAQFEKAWNDREVPNIVKDFKRMGVEKTTTEKGSYSALHVYKLMNESERAQATEILNEKIEKVWNKADAAKQRELLNAWNKILPDIFGKAE